jgi:hypothetical protein
VVTKSDRVCAAAVGFLVAAFIMRATGSTVTGAASLGHCNHGSVRGQYRGARRSLSPGRLEILQSDGDALHRGTNSQRGDLYIRR